MADVATSLKSSSRDQSDIGSWTCPRCKQTNPFVEECNNCGCPNPRGKVQTCPNCTLDNPFQATKCSLCDWKDSPFCDTAIIIERLNNIAIQDEPNKYQSLSNASFLSDYMDDDDPGLQSIFQESAKEYEHGTDDDDIPQKSNNSEWLEDNEDLFGGFNQSLLERANKNRKRKRNKNEHELSTPPQKKQRKECDNRDDIDVHDYHHTDIKEEEDFDTNLSKKEITKIDKGYQKFLLTVLKGNYPIYQLNIEYGPKFTGSASNKNTKFHQILSDTKWRPKSSLKYPENKAFSHSENIDGMDYVSRFMYYPIKTDRNLIYQNATSFEIESKLKGLKEEGMASYFFPRLLDKENPVYFPHIIVRLTKTTFAKVWNERDNKYKSFMDMINQIKDETKCSSILIILEGVAQNITKKVNDRLQNGVSNNNNHNNADFEWKDEQHLKDMMYKLYLDTQTSVRVEYTRNSSESAEYVIRTSRTLAEDRFQKLRVNALTNSNHNRKGVRSDGPKGEKDIFFSSLVGINGISIHKAAAITALYPKSGDLIAKYMVLNEEDGRELLQDIKPLNKSQKLGPALSSKIYDIYYGNMNENKVYI